MPQRIVVSFRGAIVAQHGGGIDYLARALATKKAAEAHGATLCAWSAQTFSFDLAPDELEEAIALASTALVGEPPGRRFMVGVSQGELSHVGEVGEGGSFASLSWGPPLVAAVALSREAAAGEVLLDAELLVARSSEIFELGWFVDSDMARGIHTLRPGTASSVSIPPPRPSLPAATEVAIPRAPGVPPPLPKRRARPEATPALSRPPLPTMPEDAFSEMAKRAIVQGDVVALERLIAQLRETGQSAEAIERLSGFLALRRGATSEALRKLRAVAEADQPPANRARARLTYAVALASTGRGEAALLEALDALARAREAHDANGEVACARFLARISAAAGHVGSARLWARAAAQHADPAGG